MSDAGDTDVRVHGRAPAGVGRRRFGTAPDGSPVDAITLTNARGVAMTFVTRGGAIVSLELPDRHGAFDDVVLGYDTVAGYVDDTGFFGALIGRYANRIGGARFVLDGREHALDRNDGPNQLHGGAGGFHTVEWNVEPFAGEGSVGAVLRYTSAAGEAGYPGTLRVRVTYTLTDENELIVRYHAVTDAATPVNLTQHTYLNLAGHRAGDILDHHLTLAATRFTPTDAGLIPTGELRAVHGTPFDFTVPRAIGARIDDDDEQLRVAGGYDHNFVLDRPQGGGGPAFAARLHEPRSGRTIEIHTTEPGIQFYSGNAIEVGPVGKQGHAYRRRSGVALETQHFPDSPNQPHFPSTILRPGGELASTTVYRFSSGAADTGDAAEAPA